MMSQRQQLEVIIADALWSAPEIDLGFYDSCTANAAHLIETLSRQDVLKMLQTEADSRGR